MAIVYRKLPLFTEPFYSYVIPLEGNTYKIEFLYLERINDWVFNLTDSDQNRLLSGQKLTPNTPLVIQNRIPNLSGFFYLTTKSGADPDEIGGSIRDLKDFFELLYVFDDGE